jgi:hypothetical protein
VDDALGVRRFQSIRYLNGHGQKSVHREGLTGHQLSQGLTFKELHDKEVLSFVLFNGVDSADVGVIQRGGCACFSLKTLDQLGVLSHGVRKEFQRHASA